MNIKNQLYDELEYELRESLSELMKTLGKYAGKTGAPVSLSKREAASLTLLTCYIKRRSNLFFRRKQAKDISREEFSVYLDELGGLAGTGGVNFLPFSNAGETIPIREATLFYESYYRFLANVTTDLTLTSPGTRGRIAEEETAAAKLKVHGDLYRVLYPRQRRSDEAAHGGTGPVFPSGNRRHHFRRFSDFSD